MDKRFLDRVNKSDSGCWNWTGAVNHFGYGKLHLGKKRWVMAHRYSYEMVHGPLPTDTDHRRGAVGTCVLHRCDNPRCVNPDHLYTGTVTENNADKLRKKRHSWAKLTGEANPATKYTDELVAAFKREYADGLLSKGALARKYGISWGQARRILSGENRALPTMKRIVKAQAA